MSWRDYIIGEITKGPLHIYCEGRPGSEHRRRTVGTSWVDGNRWKPNDRPGAEWEVYFGQYGDRRDGVPHSDAVQYPRMGDEMRMEITMHCPTCGLNFKRHWFRWDSDASKMVAAGITEVSLHALVRMVS
jgi:hypothetical protein